MPGTAGILFFDVGGLPGWAGAAYSLAYLGSLVALIAAYRRWALGTEAMPLWTAREDTGSRIAT